MKQIKISVPYKFEPREYQQALWDSFGEGIRRFCLVLPRRAGKDTASWCFLGQRAWETPGNYLYVFPQKNQAELALWKRIDAHGFSTFDHLPKEIIRGVNKNTLQITLTNNSTIDLVGCDDPHTKLGASIMGVVMSEYASDARMDTLYNYLAPSLRETNGWIIINSTPDGPNHFYKRAMNAKENPNWLYSRFQTLHPDQPDYYPLRRKQELDLIQSDDMLSNDDMERFYGTNFLVRASGSVFGQALERLRELGRIGMFYYDDIYPVHTFWDLGFNDYTVIWFAQYINNQVIFVDYWEGNKMDVDDIVRDVILKKPYNYAAHYLPWDAKNNYGVKETKYSLFTKTLKRYGQHEPVHTVRKPGRNKKISVITSVRTRFGKYCFNEDTCSGGLARLNVYKFKFNKILGVHYSDQIVDDDSSHTVDALTTEVLADVQGDFSKSFSVFNRGQLNHWSAR